MADLRVEKVLTSPAPALRGLVTRYNGFSFQGSSGGVHPALPSRHVTIVIPLDGPIVVGQAAGLDGDGAYQEGGSWLGYAVHRCRSVSAAKGRG